MSDTEAMERLKTYRCSSIAHSSQEVSKNDLGVILDTLEKIAKRVRASHYAVRLARFFLGQADRRAAMHQLDESLKAHGEDPDDPEMHCHRCSEPVADPGTACEECQEEIDREECEL